MRKNLTDFLVGNPSSKKFNFGSSHIFKFNDNKRDEDEP